jgi:hypothetical protein
VKSNSQKVFFTLLLAAFLGACGTQDSVKTDSVKTDSATPNGSSSNLKAQAITNFTNPNNLLASSWNFGNWTSRTANVRSIATTEDADGFLDGFLASSYGYLNSVFGSATGDTVSLSVFLSVPSAAASSNVKLSIQTTSGTDLITPVQVTVTSTPQRFTLPNWTRPSTVTGNVQFAITSVAPGVTLQAGGARALAVTAGCTINSITVAASPSSVTTGTNSALTATVSDSPVNCGTVTWSASPTGGTLTPSGKTATFASSTPGTYTLTASGGGKTGSATVTVTGTTLRDKWTRPFDATSIWNYPLGSSNTYSPVVKVAGYSTNPGNASVHTFGSAYNNFGFLLEPNPLINLNLASNLPLVTRQVWKNVQSTNAASGCAKDNGTGIQNQYYLYTPTASAPALSHYSNRAPNSAGGTGTIGLNVPDALILPADGNNNAAAILTTDSGTNTLVQLNPFYRCTSASDLYGNLTPDISIKGDGLHGGQGGSNLSSIGGVVRLGELTAANDDSIKHALKVTIWGEYLASSIGTPTSPTYLGQGQAGYVDGNQERWPATTHDKCQNSGTTATTSVGCYNTRGGSSELKMGSLLAIAPASAGGYDTPTALGIQTPIGRKLFYALRNYGAIVADDSNCDCFNVAIEKSPKISGGNFVVTAGAMEFQDVSQEVAASTATGLGFALKNLENAAGQTTNAGKTYADIKLLVAQLRVVTNNTASSTDIRFPAQNRGTLFAPLAPGFFN